MKRFIIVHHGACVLLIDIGSPLQAGLLSVLLQKSLERNDAGDHFPVLAICLGFELLTMIVSKVIYPFLKSIYGWGLGVPLVQSLYLFIQMISALSSAPFPP